MVTISEEEIVKKFTDERWLKTTFKLKQVELWQDVFFDANNRRIADIVGIGYDNNVYAFEVKKEGFDIGAAFDQVCAYTKGANFVYCVLHESSVSPASKAMLAKTNIGLIVFNLEKGVIKAEKLLDSVDHKGQYVQKTRDGLVEKQESPECFIFPSKNKNWLPKLWKKAGMASNSDVIKWGYDAKRLPPKGSIIIFSSGGELLGQGIVANSRQTTEEERKQGSHKMMMTLWTKSILEYPQPVGISEVKEHISSIRNKDLRGANLAIRYLPISFSEGQKIVQKALEHL